MGAVVLLWLLHQMIPAILLLFFALVFAIAVSAPITWLERRGMGRKWAAALVFAGIAAVTIGLGFLVVPRIGEQLTDFINAFPETVRSGQQQVASWLEPYPDLQKAVLEQSSGGEKVLGSVVAIGRRMGAISLSLLGVVTAALIIISMVIYLAVNPRPLLRGYLLSVPERHRAAAANALSNSSTMIAGWMRANLIVGAIEGVLSGIFLTLMGVPAPLVWAAFTFFAEFVPKLGPYLMAIPPILVAFSVDPMTALWVTVFYIAMSELLGDFVVPYVRGETMDLHPAIVLAFAVAMAVAFGIAGALIATPLAAFAVAHYREFYLNRVKEPEDLDASVERILDRR